MSEILNRQTLSVEIRKDRQVSTVAPHRGDLAKEKDTHRIVVVGGGAAGLELFTRLVIASGDAGRRPSLWSKCDA